MSMFRQLMMATRLPYKKLQYLESTGVQWIDTGIVLKKTDKIKIDFSADVSLASSNPCILGTTVSDNDYSGTQLGIIATGNNIIFAGRFWSSAWMNGSSVSAASNVRTTLSIQGNYLYSASGSSIYNASASTLSDGQQLRSLYVFARNSVNKLPASIKLYGFIIEDVLDLIPVLWNANTPYVDGNTGTTVTPTAAKPGMFDKVSKRLFVNQGTGADFLYA